MFANKKRDTTLKIFAIHQKSLKEYSQDNQRYGFYNLPDKNFRLKDKEIKGAEENEEEDTSENDNDLMFDTSQKENSIESRFSILQTESQSEEFE